MFKARGLTFRLLTTLFLAALVGSACAPAGPPAAQTPAAPTAAGATVEATEAGTTPEVPETGGTATPAAATGATVTVLSGAGRGSVTANAYFPMAVQVQVGDTVEWKHNSDEIHTVSFLGEEPYPSFAQPNPAGAAGQLMINPTVAVPSRQPGDPVETYDGTGFVNSGIMLDVPSAPDAPANDTFSLTFDQPGLYTYVCLVHGPSMSGMVAVSDAPTAGMMSAAEVEAQAESEINTALSNLEAVRQSAETIRQSPGPNGTTTWSVNAGSSDFLTGDARLELLEFGPKDLTIKTGDTVVWGSNTFHTVTFVPASLPPLEFIVPTPQDQGPPILGLNPQVLGPSKPTASYDPSQYYNSGIIGALGFEGQSWSLTFDTPGTYNYVCVVHLAQGMTGSITVEQR